MRQTPLALGIVRLLLRRAQTCALQLSSREVAAALDQTIGAIKFC